MHGVKDIRLSISDNEIWIYPPYACIRHLDEASYDPDNKKMLLSIFYWITLDFYNTSSVELIF